jgi:hypothetical protein
VDGRGCEVKLFLELKSKDCLQPKADVRAGIAWATSAILARSENNSLDCSSPTHQWADYAVNSYPAPLKDPKAVAEPRAS